MTPLKEICQSNHTPPLLWVYNSEIFNYIKTAKHSATNNNRINLFPNPALFTYFSLVKIRENMAIHTMSQLCN